MILYLRGKMLLPRRRVLFYRSGARADRGGGRCDVGVHDMKKKLSEFHLKRNFDQVVSPPERKRECWN